MKNKNDGVIPSESPLIVADLHGDIIYCSEAAHQICAAAVCGENVFRLFPALVARRRQARASGRRSFMMAAAETPCGEIMVDLTKEASDGLLRLYLMSPASVRELSYDEIADEFSLAAESRGHSASRRFTALYDLLVSQGTVFFRSRGRGPYNLRRAIFHFEHSVSPCLRHIGRELICREESNVTEACVIDCDIYAYYLMLSAITAAVGYASRGQIFLLASYTGDRSVVTVSTKTRANMHITDISSFGPHSVDLLYAGVLARASGCEITSDFKDDVTFTLTARTSDYYPGWLKESPDPEYFLKSAADMASRIISKTEVSQA